MVRVVLTEEQEKAADLAGGTDLKFLLAKYEVEINNQRLFYHHGINSVEKLASLAKDREDLVEVLKNHWDLDQDRSLAERVQVAAIVCAFANSVSRSQKAAEVDAEYEVQDRAKPLVPSEWTAMRQVFGKEVWPHGRESHAGQGIRGEEAGRGRVRRIPGGTADGGGVEGRGRPGCPCPHLGCKGEDHNEEEHHESARTGQCRRAQEEAHHYEKCDGGSRLETYE